ncbi:protein kinase [Parafrankia sp. FMc6]|uniref:serine/threonine protein kinase n=1 Tax=Parafrankia soli TaxID=2599596 RepID=UPI0034D4C214
MSGERRGDRGPAGPRALVGRRYRLDGVIGQGGFGVVHRATDELLGRQVAVKEVRLPTDGSEGERELARERVLREARAAGRLHHPGAVAVLDVIAEGDLPWIVMEFVDGRSLSAIIEERGRLGVGEVCRIGISLAYALEAAHRLGIVHRDVKPSNVLVTADERARLTDFGIAVSHGDPRLTSTGMVLGSPAYLAPERARGDAGTAASDRWGLGATLFTSVEGVSPFPGNDPISILAAVVQSRRRPFRAAGRLAPVIDDLMATHQARRPSLATVRSRLRDILERGGDTRPSRARSRPSRPAVTAITPTSGTPAAPTPVAPGPPTAPIPAGFAADGGDTFTAGGASPADQDTVVSQYAGPDETTVLGESVLGGPATAGARAGETHNAMAEDDETSDDHSSPEDGGADLTALLTGTTTAPAGGAPAGPPPAAPGLAGTVLMNAAPSEAPPDDTVPGEALSDDTVPGEALSDDTVPGDPLSDDTLPGETPSDDTLPGALPGEAPPNDTVPGGVLADDTVLAEASPDGTVLTRTSPASTGNTRADADNDTRTDIGTDSAAVIAAEEAGSPTPDSAAVEPTASRVGAGDPATSDARPAGTARQSGTAGAHPRLTRRLERLRAMERRRGATVERSRGAERLRPVDRMRALGGIPARARTSQDSLDPMTGGLPIPGAGAASAATGTVPDPAGSAGTEPAATTATGTAGTAGTRSTPDATGTPGTAAEPTSAVGRRYSAAAALFSRPGRSTASGDSGPGISAGPPSAPRAAAPPRREPEQEPPTSGQNLFRPPSERQPEERRHPGGVLGRPDGASAVTHSRGRRLTVILVASVVVIALAVVAAVLVFGGGDDGAEPAGAGPRPTVQADQEAAAVQAGDLVASNSEPVTAPPGWVSYVDPTGWSIAYPSRWQRRPGPGGEGNTDFVDPATGTFLRIGSIASANTSAIEDWRTNEISFRDRVRDYRRVRIEPGDGADGATQADWEFTYASGGGTVHVLNRGAVRNGHGYALYWYTAEELWEADQPLMRQLFATFRPAS